ncbi:hypothetical protein [Bacillus sp. FJAT-49736]|uniref:hypothetical protein n=1 Tax=Bacillus sp. FJAT-49736 TaxID=2833582 RepID=UPI001BC9589E|nr:hypothetical protein [Bacillus sp. FJAT-49736]MBS4175631.1 hypothetical protein [Bacillus sp. FJAT-49736]
MKKVIMTFVIGTFLVGGFVFANHTQLNSSKDNVKYLGAGGEKEPKLFSTFSASFYSFES